MTSPQIRAEGSLSSKQRKLAARIVLIPVVSGYVWILYDSTVHIWQPKLSGGSWEPFIVFTVMSAILMLACALVYARRNGVTPCELWRVGVGFYFILAWALIIHISMALSAFARVPAYGTAAVMAGMTVIFLLMIGFILKSFRMTSNLVKKPERPAPENNTS